MADRFTIVKHNKDIHWIPDVPVILSTYAISKDNQTGKLLLQLKFENLGTLNIKALYVKIKCKDTVGCELPDLETYSYLDLDVPQYGLFGDKNAIYLSNKEVRDVAVILEKVIFTENSILENIHNNEYVLLDEKKQDLNSFGNLKETYLNEVRNINTSVNMHKWVPLFTDKYITCGCGKVLLPNTEECPSCKAELNKLKEISSREYLLNKYETSAKALAESKNENDLAKSIEMLKDISDEVDVSSVIDSANDNLKTVKEVKQKRAKKTNKILIIVSSVIIILVAMFFFVVKPISEANKVKDMTSYIISGDLDEATEIKNELGAYDTWPDKMKVTLDDIFNEYLEGENYEAILSLLDFGLKGLSDEDALIVYKGVGDKYFENGEYVKAAANYRKAYDKSNKDVQLQELLAQSYYKSAVNYFDDKAYGSASAAFAMAAKYGYNGGDKRMCYYCEVLTALDVSQDYTTAYLTLKKLEEIDVQINNDDVYTTEFRDLYSADWYVLLKSID